MTPPWGLGGYFTIAALKKLNVSTPQLLALTLSLFQALNNLAVE